MLQHQSGPLHAIDPEDIELPILEHTTALSDGCDCLCNACHQAARPCLCRAQCPVIHGSSIPRAGTFVCTIPAPRRVHLAVSSVATLDLTYHLQHGQRLPLARG